MSFRKVMAFLAWLGAFVGGSTIFSATCEITGDGIWIDVPGFCWYNCGDDDDD